MFKKPVYSTRAKELAARYPVTEHQAEIILTLAGGPRVVDTCMELLRRSVNYLAVRAALQVSPYLFEWLLWQHPNLRGVELNLRVMQRERNLAAAKRQEQTVL